MLTKKQVADYERDGFVVLRSQFDENEIELYDQAYKRQNPHSSIPPNLKYPTAGRYTLAHSCMSDPDLASIAEHPNILDPVETLLQDEPLLTAFVVYDRTPGGPGLPKHNDYKRWRPVGSSMNWLFAIVPFTDYDAEAGQLFVSPGSHNLDRIQDRNTRTLHVEPPVTPSNESFIDPGLCRGDLLLMNMHCWHRAGPNKSKRPRAGFFNKYGGKHSPPATGYYLYNHAAFNALSKNGQKLIAVHDDRPIGITQMLLEKPGRDGSEYLLVRNKQGKWDIPGGKAWEEQAIPDWDVGNYIAPLHAAMRETLRIETPWASYVGDYSAGTELSRVYAYELNHNGFPVPYEGEWLSRDKVADADCASPYLLSCIDAWADPEIIRGKGLTQAQSRIDQFAY